MQYFDTLPKIIHTDTNGISKIMTNIMARVSVLPDVLKNPLVYYQYDIQEGDTPEIIAHKYYGDSYRYWIVLFANQLLDPQWNWPLNYKQFSAYIAAKYSPTDVYTTIHHYEKIITKLDYGTNTTTTDTIVIDEDTYYSIVPGTHVYSLPTGLVSVTTDKAEVTLYEYETKLNESKRTINILNSIYVNEMETQFQKLLSS